MEVAASLCSNDTRTPESNAKRPAKTSSRADVPENPQKQPQTGRSDIFWVLFSVSSFYIMWHSLEWQHLGVVIWCFKTAFWNKKLLQHSKSPPPARRDLPGAFGEWSLRKPLQDRMDQEPRCFAENQARRNRDVKIRNLDVFWVRNWRDWYVYRIVTKFVDVCSVFLQSRKWFWAHILREICTKHTNQIET